MGYSCSAKASLTLKAIERREAYRADSFDQKYFIEIGKENKDGSITGTVWELFFDNNIQRRCKKKGGFKIDKEGRIVRFPTISKQVWECFFIEMKNAYEKTYAQIGYNF